MQRAQEVGSCSAIILFWPLGADLGVMLVMASFYEEGGKDGKKSKGKSTICPLRDFFKGISLRRKKNLRSMAVQKSS